MRGGTMFWVVDDDVVEDDDVAEDDGVVEGDFVVDDVTETNSQGPGQWSGRNGQCLSWLAWPSAEDALFVSEQQEKVKSSIESSLVDFNFFEVVLYVVRCRRIYKLVIAGEGNESRKRDPDSDCKVAEKTDNSCLESEHRTMHFCAQRKVYVHSTWCLSVKEQEYCTQVE